nr:hypothetical protein [Tanacetum cinerariifolium]
AAVVVVRGVGDVVVARDRE